MVSDMASNADSTGPEEADMTFEFPKLSLPSIEGGTIWPLNEPARSNALEAIIKSIHLRGLSQLSAALISDDKGSSGSLTPRQGPVSQLPSDDTIRPPCRSALDFPETQPISFGYATNDPLVQKFRHVLVNGEVDAGWARVFVSLENVLVFLGSILFVKPTSRRDPPLPGYIPKDTLDVAQEAIRRMLAFFDMISTGLQPRMQFIRNIRPQLPDITPLRDGRLLMTASAIWKRKLEPIRPMTDGDAELNLLFAELFDAIVYHDFMRMRRAYPNHHLGVIARQLDHAYIAVEEVAALTSEMQAAVRALCTTVLSIEHKLLQDPIAGRFDYHLSRWQARVDRRTGRSDASSDGGDVEGAKAPGKEVADRGHEAASESRSGQDIIHRRPPRRFAAKKTTRPGLREREHTI